MLILATIPRMEAAPPQTILLVEDNPEVRMMARTALRDAGYRVLEAETKALGVDLFRKNKPELLVLDVDLPDGNGLDICREVRAHPVLSKTPVIMLTAKGEIEDKGAGFEAGADHYLIKPMTPQELVMWAQALLRRVQLDAGEGPLLKVGDLEIDAEGRLVKYQGQLISTLTVKEFDLLHFLVRKKRKVLSRKFILTNLWHTVAVDNLVDVHIGKLRRKLPQELADMIQTIPGKGFRFLD